MNPKCIHILILFCFAIRASSQDVQYRTVRKYTSDRGLTTYNVKNIVEDSKGFIWVATQGGLNRFDGKTFISYTTNEQEGRRINGSDVREIINDTTNGLIWIVATEGGLNGIDVLTGTVKAGASIPYTNNDAFSVAMSLIDNKLWIGSFSGVKIYDIKSKRFIDLPLPETKAVAPGYYEALKIFQDGYGNVWVCYCGYGIVIYNSKSLSVIKTIPIAQLNDHLQLQNIRCNDALLRTNDLLLATSQGFRRILFDQQYQTTIINSPCATLPWANTEEIRSLENAHDGTMLFASRRGLFQCNYTLDSITVLRESDNSIQGEWFTAAQFLYMDKEENVWIGCQQGLGFFSAEPSPFKSFYRDNSSNNKLEHVRSILPVNSSKALVGLLNGLATVDLTNGNIDIEDPQNTYHHVFIDPFGRTIVSRSDGMFVYQHHSLTPLYKVYPEFEKSQTHPTNSHVSIGDSVLLMGTEDEKGILVWNYKNHHVRELGEESKPSLGFNVVNNIYLDSKSNIWVLSDKKITVLDQKFQPLNTFNFINTTTGKPIVFYFDVCELNGFFWITAYGTGLLKVNHEYELVSVVSNKLSDRNTYQAFPYQHSLVITSDNGITVYNTNDNTSTTYFRDDGLHSNSFEEVSGVSKDGKIYAGGVQGFTEMDLNFLKANTSKPVLYVHQVNVQTTGATTKDTFNLDLQEFSIPSNYQQANIRFTAIGYINPRRITYYYRFNNKSEWVNNGNRDFIPIIDFNPRKYTLQVQASNENGIFSNIVELMIIVRPKWYQTDAFNITVIVLVGLLIYGFFKYRIKQIRKEEAIRKRISSDLHDDIGSTLNSVKVYANLALSQPENTDYLVRVKQSSQEAISGLRDVIWVLDDKQDTIEQLAAKISLFAKALCDANNISFTQNVDPDLYGKKLGKEEKRNIYLILKESINNSIKYSEGSNIEFSIQQDSRRINFVVRDNGKGFDSNSPKSGNGLKNIQYRAKQIHYKATIQSFIDQGTITTLFR